MTIQGLRNTAFLFLLTQMLRCLVPASSFAPRAFSSSSKGASIIRLPSAFVVSSSEPRLLERKYSATVLSAKPKRGTVVESYRSVSVNCAKCRQRLFRYKKKNGTKSNLVKCYVERIAEDSAGVLEKEYQQRLSNYNNNNDDDATTDLSQRWSDLVQDLPLGYGLECPNCHSSFARSAQIHGLPALKMVGGKVTMTKK